MSVLQSNSPASRAERRRNLTREQLRNAAAELLLEVGYHKLTIKAITDRADLGYGTFYLYFQEKDDIVWEAIHDVVEMWRLQVEDEIGHLPHPHHEYQSWIRVFRYVEQAKQGFVDVFGRGGSAKLLQHYQDYLANMHELNLRNGVYSSGLDLPPEFLAQMTAGALVRLMLWWAETPNSYTPEDMTRMLYTGFYRQPPPE